MQSKDVIKMTMGCRSMVMALIRDMKDAPLTFPTANGGCHPLWVLGHVTLTEAVFLHTWIRGEENPLAGWEELFGPGAKPSADAAVYPSFDEMMAKSDEVHAALVAALESCSEEDLDQPSKAPEEFKAMFGTVRQLFLMSGLHWMAHRGQVADARLTAGRERLSM